MVRSGMVRPVPRPIHLLAPAVTLATVQQHKTAVTAPKEVQGMVQ